MYRIKGGDQMYRIKEGRSGVQHKGDSNETCRIKGPMKRGDGGCSPVTTVGFEPTPLARPAPKAGALDHSATLSGNIASRLDN